MQILRRMPGVQRALVTGGAGFIGGHLVERLLTDGHQVHVVDDLSSNPIPLEQLLHELDHPARLGIWTVPIEDFVSDHRRGTGTYDAIFHLASPVGPAGILPHAGKIVQQVVDDTYRVIALAKQTGARLIDVSTSEVYGGGQGGLCREDMRYHIPAQMTARVEYAVAKLAAEAAILNTPDLDAVIVRPFNVAGPRQSATGGFVLPRFVGQALGGGALTVFGTGGQVRAFTHVTDIADGLVRAWLMGTRRTVYNLGNPANRTTILALAERVIGQVGRGTISYTSGQTVYGSAYAEADDKWPDSDKARHELDWQPERDIETTIRDVIAYEQVKRGEPAWR